MNLSDAIEIKVNNKTVSEIDCLGALIYPFTDLEINCIWDDLDNWDGVRPTSVYIPTNFTYKGRTNLFKYYKVDNNNEWSISERVPAYTYSVSPMTISSYTYSVSQSENEINVTYSRPIQTMDVPISIVSSISGFTTMLVDLEVDGEVFETKLFNVNSQTQQYFYDVPMFSKGGASFSTCNPVPESDPSHNVIITGNSQNGFIITVYEITGTLSLNVVVDANASSYQSNIQYILVDIHNATTGAYVRELHYSDFTVSSYGNNVLLQYSIELGCGDYYIECVNADTLMDDCVLSPSSLVDATVTIEEGSTSSQLLYLEYELPDE